MITIRDKGTWRPQEKHELKEKGNRVPSAGSPRQNQDLAPSGISSPFFFISYFWPYLVSYYHRPKNHYHQPDRTRTLNRLMELSPTNECGYKKHRPTVIDLLPNDKRTKRREKKNAMMATEHAR
jgi:hypothetical protein